MPELERMSGLRESERLFQPICHCSSHAGPPAIINYTQATYNIVRGR